MTYAILCEIRGGKEKRLLPDLVGKKLSDEPALFDSYEAAAWTARMLHLSKSKYKIVEYCAAKKKRRRFYA